MSRYLFVDGGHIRQHYIAFAQRWFGNEDALLSIDRLKSLFSPAKCFWYDLLDDEPREDETPDQTQTRISPLSMFFDEIESSSATHLYRGELSEGKKQIDILLAVDAMNHASRRNMDHAVILTGDRAFTPLVESLVDMGVMVEVAGDKKHTSPSLIRAADTYTPLSSQHYYSITNSLLADTKPLPDVRMHSPNDASGYVVRDILKTGTIGLEYCELCEMYDEIPMKYMIQGEKGSMHRVILSNHLFQLEMYCEEFLFEPVVWK